MKDTLAFDSVPEESTEVATELPAGPEGESLSLDLFGENEPAVGDTVTLKVTAIDPENGRVTVILPGAAKPGGIDAAAAAMDETDGDFAVNAGKTSI